MKILYVHGFGSAFDTNNDKVIQLRNLGEVVGPNLDYTEPTAEINEQLKQFVLDNQIDLIVGTSLGAYYGATVGAAFGIPFVAINPAIDPSQTLKKFEGTGTTFLGKPYTLTAETIAEYSKFPITGNGLILLDLGDDLIDPYNSQRQLQQYEVHTFAGGSHRFDHTADSLPLIEKFYHTSQLTYEN